MERSEFAPLGLSNLGCVRKVTDGQQDLATLPPRIFRKRTVAAGIVYGASMGAAFFIYIYFLPIWFQVCHVCP